MPESGIVAWQAHRALGRAGFVSKFAHPFLVCFDWEAALADVGDDDEPAQFRTVAVSADLLARATVRNLTRALITPVAKTGRNPYQFISVGRSSNCDIVLAHPSISKLHFYLEVAEPGEAKLTDAGSRNGTIVRGVRLGSKQAVPLHAGDDVVVAGRVPLRFLDPGRLFELL